MKEGKHVFQVNRTNQTIGIDFRHRCLRLDNEQDFWVHGHWRQTTTKVERDTVTSRSMEWRLFVAFISLWFYIPLVLCLFVLQSHCSFISRPAMCLLVIEFRAVFYTSLVMCMSCNFALNQGVGGQFTCAFVSWLDWRSVSVCLSAVSYTHLTLPTMAVV